MAESIICFPNSLSLDGINFEIGDIVYNTRGNIIDENWLLCDGSLVDINTYPLLKPYLFSYPDIIDGEWQNFEQSDPRINNLSNLYILYMNNLFYIYGYRDNIIYIWETEKLSNTTWNLKVQLSGYSDIIQLYNYDNKWIIAAINQNGTYSLLTNNSLEQEGWKQSSNLEYFGELYYINGLYILAGITNDRDNPTIIIQYSQDCVTFSNYTFSINNNYSNIGYYGIINLSYVNEKYILLTSIEYNRYSSVDDSIWSVPDITTNSWKKEYGFTDYIFDFDTTVEYIDGIYILGNKKQATNLSGPWTDYSNTALNLPLEATAYGKFNSIYVVWGEDNGAASIAYSDSLEGPWTTKSINANELDDIDSTSSRTTTMWITTEENIPIAYCQAREWENDDDGTSGIQNALCYLEDINYYLPDLENYKNYYAYIKAK